MTQNATVVQVLSNGMAKIVVARQSACAHDCRECGGCGTTPSPVYAQAENLIHAEVGDKVEVESSTQTVLGVALLVYFLPLVLFFLGIALAWGSEWRYFFGAVGFAAGVAVAVVRDKKLKEKGGLPFRIVRRLG